VTEESAAIELFFMGYEIAPAVFLSLLPWPHSPRRERMEKRSASWICPKDRHFRQKTLIELKALNPLKRAPDINRAKSGKSPEVSMPAIRRKFWVSSGRMGFF
jgi:hypothetical protein